MKALVLSHLFPPNGGTFVLEQMKALREQGVSSRVIAPTPWPPFFLRSLPRLRRYVQVPQSGVVEDFRVEYPRFACLPRSLLFYLQGLSIYERCRPVVRRLKTTYAPDLIHAHTVMPDGFAALLLGQEFSLPVVCTVHGSDVKLYPRRNRATRWATQWALRGLPQLVAVSNDLKQSIFNLAGVGSVNVLHNGANPKTFARMSREEARRTLALPSTIPIVLFVGNLVPIKGLQFLLRAIAHLHFYGLQLFLVGDGEERTLLAALAQQLGISTVCHFVGFRPHDEVSVWLSAADCLVLPSLSEGMPTILVEAMFSQTPIVATSVGGVPEVIEHNRSGLLVAAGDADALAAAIARVLTQPQAASQMAKNASDRAVNNLTWETNAREMVRIYETAIAEYKSLPRPRGLRASDDSHRRHRTFVHP